MKAFLSFGFYDIREQQLVSSSVILKHLIELTLDIIAQCPGLKPCGILASHALDIPADVGLPCYDIRPCDRTLAEIDALRTLMIDSSDKETPVLVLRPAQGALFRSRLRHFYEAIQDCEEQLMLSTIQCTSMVHPMWNVRVAGRHFFSKSAIRHPRSGTNFVQPLSTICPELWTAMEKDKGYQPKGSQHLEPMYRSDGALYSIRLSGNADAPSPEPYSIVCPYSNEPKESLLLRLPVFQMSRDMSIDVSTLEALLIKSQENP